jgi:GxxExxY protein
MNTHQYGLKNIRLTDPIIGVFYEVHNELGFGFLESVYEASMSIALAQKGVPHETQKPLNVYFRNRLVGEFRVDVLTESEVLLEVKAVRALEPVHEAQILNYLGATDMEIGLLLNFGPKPQVRRFLFDNSRKKTQPSIESHDVPQRGPSS